MKLAIASDHRGYELKKHLIEHLDKRQNSLLRMTDLGPLLPLPVDYPDFAEKLGKFIIQGFATRGILICGSGVGASIAANKIPGIRAALCNDVYSAHQGVEDDDMNVLVLGSGSVGPLLAQDLVHAFLQAHFQHEERHMRRLRKIALLEERLTQRSA